MLFVTEIFKSIQGESTFIGLPCIFVRLSGCNLRCRYCDTKYAYRGGTGMEISEIVRAAKLFGIPLVEITGGEPLLQEETPALARALLRNGYRVMVETNGSLDISRLPNGVIRIMDVKCPSSGQSRRMLWSNIGRLQQSDQVKFVMANRRDYGWAKSVMEQNRLPRKCPVLFSPVWGRLDPAQLASWMVKDKAPPRLQVRLHKVLWPKQERGV